MALHRHRLPRLWVLVTLGLLATGLGAVRWWEGQLPQRLAHAASAGRLDACLRYSEQLAALQWLSGRAPQEQGQCRRRKAAELWRLHHWREALQLQQQLVNSKAAVDGDRRQLEQWQRQLSAEAQQHFLAGDLPGALGLLKPLQESGQAEASAVAALMRETWERNRQQLQLAERLTRKKLWWEALDALNRLDHPWWKLQAGSLSAQVTKAVKQLHDRHEEHDSHGALEHSVAPEQLDRLVRQLIEQDGLDDWTAFNRACRRLGGRVVEAGPETACQR